MHSSDITNVDHACIVCVKGSMSNVVTCCYVSCILSTLIVADAVPLTVGAPIGVATIENAPVTNGPGTHPI